MMNRVTVYFDDEKLRKDLEVYCKEHHTSFSKAVLDFTAAGYSLYQETGSLDTKLQSERAKRFLEAKKEIEFLRSIIRSNADQINKLLGMEMAPVDDTNPPTKSVVGVPITGTNQPSGSAVEVPDPPQKQEAVDETAGGIGKLRRHIR